jgi:hypothetical protein
VLQLLPYPHIIAPKQWMLIYHRTILLIHLYPYIDRCRLLLLQNAQLPSTLVGILTESLTQGSSVHMRNDNTDVHYRDSMTLHNCQAGRSRGLVQRFKSEQFALSYAPRVDITPHDTALRKILPVYEGWHPLRFWKNYEV